MPVQESNPFSQASHVYAQARPRYPRDLYNWMLAHTSGRDAVWDCATGSGQAAVDLAPHFARVEATDISAEQVGEGMQQANIHYSIQSAEETSFLDQTFDLVTVAQALHWFDYTMFWPEVLRVAKLNALFCAWGYAWFTCDSEVDTGFVQPFLRLVEPYWAMNNRILWDGFNDEDIAFPFKRITPPRLAIQTAWTIAQLIEYMQTWSAYKHALKNETMASGLQKLCADAAQRFVQKGAMQITMPLHIVAGHVMEL